MRSGRLDPVSGQRSAFPLDLDSIKDDETKKVAEYLRGVRQESQAIVYEQVRKRHAPMDELDYGPETSSFAGKHTSDPHDAREGTPIDLSECWEITKKLYGDNLAQHEDPPKNFSQLYDLALSSFRLLEPQHPAECDSLAKWKHFCAHNWPIPVNHTDTFRLFKYLIKWASGTPPQLHFVWAYALLLRTPKVLDGSEISQLRDLCRALQPHAASQPLVEPFIRICASVFHQYDMLELIAS